MTDPVCVECGGSPVVGYTRSGGLCAAHFVRDPHGARSFRSPEKTERDLEAELVQARRPDGSWDLIEVEKLVEKYHATRPAVDWGVVAGMMDRLSKKSG